MKKSTLYEKKITDILMPILEKEKLKLYDVDYVKEGEGYYLRVFIDKDSGVGIDDCENVSRALSKLLDVDDFIEDSYILEVSSPGLTRTLKKDKEFELNRGKLTKITLFKPDDNGKKEYVGILNGFDELSKTVSLLFDDTELKFEKNSIASIRLSMEDEREDKNGR